MFDNDTTDDSRIDAIITDDADADIRVFNTATDTEINRYATVDDAVEAIETLVFNTGAHITRDDYEIQVVPSVTAESTDDDSIDSENNNVAFVSSGDRGKTWTLVGWDADPITDRTHAQRGTAELAAKAINDAAAEAGDEHPEFETDLGLDYESIANRALAAFHESEYATAEEMLEAEHGVLLENDSRFDDLESFDTNAERLAADDDVIFAITREDSPAWADETRDFLKMVAIGACIGLLFDLLTHLWNRATSDEDDR